MTKVTPEKRAQFIAALENGASVTKAARATRISRQEWYRTRKDDEAFAAAWDAAIEIGTDALEDEAVRRAVIGVRQPVFQGGKLVGYVRVHSDFLLNVLLKARRPEKFRERASVEHTGKGGGPIEVSDARERLAGRIARLAARAGEAGGASGTEQG
ncbi:MAG: terminase [Alphaproteobacteria bacterium]